MAFSNSYTAITGGTLSAAEWNTNIKDNWSAVWPYTTAGDIAYATSAVALARAGIGANGTVFKSNGSAPAWVAQSTLTDIPGQLHAQAEVTFHNEQTRQSATFADVTGGTVNIVTTKTCDIYMFAWAMLAVQVGGQHVTIRGSIAGTADATAFGEGLPFTSNPYYTPAFYAWKRTGIAAGTKTVKLQWASTTAGSVSGYLYGGRIVAQAFVS